MSVQFHKRSGMIGNSHRHRAMHGFSLIEIVVVMMLIAIILATAIPMGIQWRKARALNHAADELVYQLQRAKMTAIKEFTSVAIIIDTAKKQYYLDRTSSCSATSAAQTFPLGNQSDGVVFNGSGYTSDDCVVFIPSGVAARTGAFYLANDDGLKYRIRVTGAGGISKRVYSKDDDSWYQLGK